ncbi:MAG TPA: anthranilate phosphoribosyltransferase [Gammaproteobacteria bacterium]|jgi:anthranilate phosphoribosyltransferase
MSVKPAELLAKLVAATDLEESEAGELLCALAAGAVEPALAGGLLIALKNKGESAAEIRGFALAMRALAQKPKIPPGKAYVDIVGTGGDGSGSLNLSTGSALLAAASGLSVVKHGNRSVTSRSGSADVLTALGMAVPLDEEAVGAALRELGFTFLFAPAYHPAMKQIAPIRAALGVRTVFNILGPLVNPAAPPFHVIGAPSEKIAALMADALAEMPLERAFVIHGAEGWDEPTPIGPFLCYDVRSGKVVRTTRDPAQAGLARCTAADLKGADAAHNAARLRTALEGNDTAAHRDALALGAGLALEVTGTCRDLAEGVERAKDALADDTAARLLERLDAFTARLKTR